METRWPLYVSESCVEQERIDDMAVAKNLGDLEIVFEQRAYARQFVGVEIRLVKGILTKGTET